MILHRDRIALYTEIDTPLDKPPSNSKSKANYETVPTECDLALITMNTSMSNSIDKNGPDQLPQNL